MINSTKPNKKTKFNTNLVNLILLFCCFAFFTFGCKQNNENSAIQNNENSSVKSETKPILVNLPALINKTPQEVEKIVGTSKEVYPIYKGYSDANPKIGEGRVYDLPALSGKAVDADDYTVRVDYYQGKSVYLYARFPEQQSILNEFGRRCGFDLSGKSPTETYPENIRWSGNINGIPFTEVTLWRSLNNKDKFYACECETKKIPR